MAEFSKGDRIVKMSGIAAGKYGTVNSVREDGTLNVTFDGERLSRFCDPERCGKVAANASLADFSPGMKVRISRVQGADVNPRKAEWVGREGIVRKTIKSRGLVAVDYPGHGLYESIPENLEIVNFRAMNAAGDSKRVNYLLELRDKRRAEADKAWHDLYVKYDGHIPVSQVKKFDASPIGKGREFSAKEKAEFDRLIARLIASRNARAANAASFDNPNYDPAAGMKYLDTHFQMFDPKVAKAMIEDARRKGVKVPPGVLEKARRAGIVANSRVLDENGRPVKIGDRVRLSGTTSPGLGKRGVVVKIDDDWGDVTVKTDDGRTYEYTANAVEKISNSRVRNAKFKVGDRFAPKDDLGMTLVVKKIVKHPTWGVVYAVDARGENWYTEDEMVARNACARNAKFKVGDRVAYYGKDPAIYRKRGKVSDVSQIRGETFVTVDLDDGEEWGAPEKDWSFMNSCARNAVARNGLSPYGAVSGLLALKWYDKKENKNGGVMIVRAPFEAVKRYLEQSARNYPYKIAPYGRGWAKVTAPFEW